MGPVSEQDMFNDIFKVNLFSNHHMRKMNYSKQKHRHRYAYASVHVNSHNSQTHRIPLSLCGSVFSGIMLHMKTVCRSCLQDVRDICKTDYILWVKSQCLRGVLETGGALIKCQLFHPLSWWSFLLICDLELGLLSVPSSILRMEKL